MRFATFLLGCLLAGALAGRAQTTPPAAPAAATPVATTTGEFNSAADGLIYAPRTMSRLRRIVDSLNLRHKVCELRRDFHSRPQGLAHYVRLEQDDLAAARQALAAGLTPDAFLARFPQARVEKNLLVVSRVEADADDDRPGRAATTVYESLPFNGEGEYELRQPGRQPVVAAGQWVVASTPRTEYSAASVEGFYFPAGLAQAALPTRYAALVQYADCLIDTTAQIYLPGSPRTGARYASRPPRAVQALLTYVHQQTHRPVAKANSSEEETDRYWETYQAWEAGRAAQVAHLAGTPRFRELLARAVADPATRGATDDEFEEYVARYVSARKALEYKRSRRVVGMCSMDSSPRYHALGIAQLSAEAVSWEIFLRAHLDIMNDRFERVSDGSYAQAGRQTYLRELEELDINVPDLLLGISLRIDNAGRYHYFGDLGRLGRALAETRQPAEVERRMLAVVADPGLDAFNRVLAYYLYLSYTRHLPDPASRPQKLAALNQAVQQLPAYLVARATVRAGQR